ncbi:unannotated protein [freshwater metagenome]|uniref:Unannotated protein n=1 Tax=freshwater metagenome TaxID=449393 RepID=A0A6J7CSP0_9ZZZZ
MFTTEKSELIVVTGKGGVGRTTISAALGIATASAGTSTVVCEVSQQAVIPALLGASGKPVDGVISAGPGLSAASIDPDATLRDWIRGQFGGTIAKTLGSSKSFSQLIAAAPGAAELLTITKAWELGPGRGFGKSSVDHDTVILDAPASGHGIAMLRSPRTFADIAAGGQIRKQAEKVWDLLRDETRCAIVAVTLPSELPVTETVELDGWLHDVLGRRLDLVVVNRCESHGFTSRDLGRIGASVTSGELKRAAIDVADAAADRQNEQDALIGELEDQVGAPTIRLPELSAGLTGPEIVSQLAELITAQLT